MATAASSSSPTSPKAPRQGERQGPGKSGPQARWKRWPTKRADGRKNCLHENNEKILFFYIQNWHVPPAESWTSTGMTLPTEGPPEFDPPAKWSPQPQAQRQPQQQQQQQQQWLNGSKRPGLDTISIHISGGGGGGGGHHPSADRARQVKKYYSSKHISPNTI